ncbi:hypothetical protein HYU92_04095 [Candidatus Curtissbacteria bacterium]|nr:hypothetical protein [Candidatus Curtissbacteria bacterium]
MTPDLRPSDNNEDDKPTTREEIAFVILTWLQESPSEVVEAADLMMWVSENHALVKLRDRLRDAYLKVDGVEVSDWFTRGVSAAFMYFHEVGQDIDKTDIPVITQGTIDSFRSDAGESRRQRMIASEFLLGDELAAERLRRVNKIYDQTDKNLLLILMETRLRPENKAVSEKALRAFLEGGIIVNNLFDKQVQSA